MNSAVTGCCDRGKTLDWAAAFLLGFGWEAAIEKIMRPPSQSLAAPSQASLWLIAAALLGALVVAYFIVAS
jgi:hypothetical protein